jgi:hypothetical protein
MSNCKCCNAVICDCKRYIKSFDIDILGQKFTVPVNRTIKDLGCYEYFYVGAATEYYFYNTITKKPIKEFYKNIDIYIEFSINQKQYLENFSISENSDPASLKYAEIKIVDDLDDIDALNLSGNLYLNIRFPDERILKKCILKYKDAEIRFYNDSFEFIQSLNNALKDYPEFKGFDETYYSDKSKFLPQLNPLNLIIEGDIYSNFSSSPGTIGMSKKVYDTVICETTERLINYYSLCSELKNSVNAKVSAYVKSEIVGFFVEILSDKSLGTIYLNCYPSYYIDIKNIFKYPDSIDFKFNDKSYSSYCDDLNNGFLPIGDNQPEPEGRTHESQLYGCPATLRSR